MNPKEDDSEWKFETTSRIGNDRGTNLAYDVLLCEPISSDNEQKEGDNLSGNHLVNLKKLTTNVEKFQCDENVQRIRLYR